jgi:cyclic pyranopterin phosphate synthase
MPADGVPKRTHDQVLRIEEFLEVVAAAARLGITKVRLTGGEPLVRRGNVDLVRGVATTPGITKVGLTTNGARLAPLARELRLAGLTHLNVSIDTLDPVRYREITRMGNLDDAIKGVLAAREAGFHPIKINTVVTDAIDEDDLDAIKAFCRTHGFVWQRIAEFSLSEEKRDALHLERPLPCAECNRIRLLSNGKLKPCLHSNEEIDIDWNDIDASIVETVRKKPERGTVCTNRYMAEIGG